MADFDAQLIATTGGVSRPEFEGQITGGSFEIAQLEGDNPITVLLRGRAMPYPAVAFEGEQHSKLTWYPGNPVATQQVLGPRESSTTIHGFWKDRFIRGSILKNGSDTAIQSAAQAVQLFEQLRRAGKRVRVQWSHQVRSGLIKRFVATPDRVQDQAWEIEFEFASRDDEEAPKASTEQAAPAGNDLLKRQNALEDLATLSPDMAFALAAEVISRIQGIRDQISKVVDLLRIVETAVNLPGAVLGALKASVASLGRQLTELLRRITGERVSAQDRQTATRGKGDYTNPAAPGRRGARASSSLTQEAQFEIWRRSMGLSAAALLFQLQVLTDDVIQRSRPATTRVITVGEGDTLYSLAVRFYGSSDFANFLALSNRLTTALVPPGYRLRVPDRPLGAAAQIEPLTSRQPGVGDGRCC